MTKHIARHRAATQSHAVRNTGIAVAAAGVIAGSVAPANAFATAAPADNASYTTQSSNVQTADFSTQASNTQAVDNGAQASNTQDAGNTNVSGDRAKIVEDAKAGIGGSYVWGGSDFKAWDCSGFVSYVAAQSGVQLDSYTHSMKNQLTPTSAPQPGDVVFTNGYEHVGIYLGDGQMVSALNPSQGTEITSVDGGGMMPVDGYYSMPGM
ncbi:MULTISPECIES: C40 family peptidase [Micrococcaceae]|uniref:C40 family peptidase n=1 Tax=unclassified Kocuria TaxID=2649579 RepID=UPI001012192C|nr:MULTISPECIES: C40 family peptidase [unclassified Kocuria]